MMKSHLAQIVIVVVTAQSLVGCGPTAPAQPAVEEVQRELQILKEELARTRSQAEQGSSARRTAAGAEQQGLQQWSLRDQPTSLEPSAAPAQDHRRTETAPRQNGPEQVLQYLILQGLAEQQRQQQAQHDQRFQKFQSAVEQASICQACGGNGSYRFVDASGQLRLQSCPYCQGLGRKW